MATKMVATLFDDLEPTQEAAETIPFAYDGKSYEIDLSETNATEFRDWLDHYAKHGRKSAVNRQPRAARKSTSRGGRRRTQSGPAQRKAFNAKIRRWAHEQGLVVNERGRIPESVVAAYREAHKH